MPKNALGCLIFLFIFWIIGLIFTAIIYVIFSALDNKYDAFKQIQLTNYKKKSYYKFLYEIDFGEELKVYNDYSCSLTDLEGCYEGKCRFNYHYYHSNNCSKACMNNLNECFYNYQKCEYFECKKYDWETSNSLCKYKNRITKWRNTKMLKYINIYDIKPFSQVKPQNERCPYGYRKCGIINENMDILCLNENNFDFKCPINDIIVSTNDIIPEGNYKRFKMGDKVIFYTNDKTDNYIITDFYITFSSYENISPSQIDYDSFSNFSSFNNISLGGFQKAILNVIQFRLNYTYQEMLKSQEFYEKLSEIYPDEKINEMNDKIDKISELEIQLYFLTIMILFIILFSSLKIYGRYKSMLNKSFLYEELIRDIILIYVCISPFIFFEFYFFIITISKMITYNKYSSMEYIDLYKIDDNLEKSFISKRNQFICLLINITIIVLYPILIIKIFHPKRNYGDSLISNKKKREAQNDPLTPNNYKSSSEYQNQGEKAYYE